MNILERWLSPSALGQWLAARQSSYGEETFTIATLSSLIT